MDKLKSAIADKVLEISSLSGEDMKPKLEKINRFRDFVDACRSLITRYPSIETELLRMVENNDFDTKIASSRVDTIIRLSETNSSNDHIIKEDISELEEITEQLPTKEDTQSEVTIDETKDSSSTPENSLEQSVAEKRENEDSKKEISSTKRVIIENKEIEPEKYLPEDIEYEDVTEDKENQEKEYVDFEEIREKPESAIDELALSESKPVPQLNEMASSSESKSPSHILDEEKNRLDTAPTILALPETNIEDESKSEIVSKTNDSEPKTAPILDTQEKVSEVNTSSSIKKQNGTTQETAKRALQVVLIIAIIVALIFIIVFIIQNTATFLWGFGITLIIAAIVCFFIKKKKGDNDE